MFSLTREEKLVLLSLITLAVLGLGTRIILKRSFSQGVPGNIFTNISVVSVNSASQKELQKIPGIGEVLAARIIEYRNTHGSFESKAELENIKGIGPQKLKRFSGFII